jgi:hypothetical protein
MLMPRRKKIVNYLNLEKNELIKNIKKIKLLKPENVFSSKAIHALYLVSNSKITPEDTRMKLILSIKEIYDHSNMHQIKVEKASFLKAKFAILEKQFKEYIEDEIVKQHLTSIFTPSKLATNALNFIDQYEEKKLQRINDSDIINVFKFIFILINKEIPENPIQNLIKNIIPRMKFKNLSYIS